MCSVCRASRRAPFPYFSRFAHGQLASLTFTRSPYLYGIAAFYHGCHGLSCLPLVLTLLDFVGIDAQLCLVVCSFPLAFMVLFCPFLWFMFLYSDLFHQ
jgi:hypothetical protein